MTDLQAAHHKEDATTNPIQAPELAVEDTLPLPIPPFDKALYDLDVVPPTPPPTSPELGQLNLYNIMASGPTMPPPTPPIAPPPAPISTALTTTNRVTTITPSLPIRKIPVTAAAKNLPSQSSITTVTPNSIQDLALSYNLSNAAEIPHTVTSVLSLDQPTPPLLTNGASEPPSSPPRPPEAEVAATDNNGLVAQPVMQLPPGGNYVDITEYLNLPQSEAAKKLGIPSSTLSKRWKEAVPKRKWPWRAVCKIDKEIMTLLHNVPQGSQMPEDVEGRLSSLMKKRQEQLKGVVIRL